MFQDVLMIGNGAPLPPPFRSMVLCLFAQLAFMVADRVTYLFRSVRAKLLLQLVSVVFWVHEIFFHWPRVGETGFRQNPMLQLFFMLKLMYFYSFLFARVCLFFDCFLFVFRSSFFFLTTSICFFLAIGLHQFNKLLVASRFAPLTKT